MKTYFKLSRKQIGILIVVKDVLSWATTGGTGLTFGATTGVFQAREAMIIALITFLARAADVLVKSILKSADPSTVENAEEK